MITARPSIPHGADSSLKPHRGEYNTKMDAFWYQAEKELLADRASENGGANELTHGFASVAAEIVQDDDIAGTKGR